MPLKHTIGWTFAATNAASRDACMQAENWARETGLPEVLIMRLVLVIEELFTNTIKHGYHSESNRPVQIALAAKDGRAELDYRDQAPAFDPIHACIRHVPEQPPVDVGGMGLRLIQTLGHKASYAYQDGWNIVRLAVGADAVSL
jgi:serine/threonine-protein kinase RsbW